MRAVALGVQPNHDTAGEQVPRDPLGIRQRRRRVARVAEEQDGMRRIRPLLLREPVAGHGSPGRRDGDTLAHELVARPGRADPAALGGQHGAVRGKGRAGEGRGPAACVHAAYRGEGARPGGVGLAAVGVPCAGRGVAACWCWC